jgi:hypothetical protein
LIWIVDITNWLRHIKHILKSTDSEVVRTDLQQMCLIHFSHCKFFILEQQHYCVLFVIYDYTYVNSIIYDYTYVNSIIYDFTYVNSIIYDYTYVNSIIYYTYVNSIIYDYTYVKSIIYGYTYVNSILFLLLTCGKLRTLGTPRWSFHFFFHFHFKHILFINKWNGLDSRQ